MASTCISSCVSDARVPIRATYVNLYKWPESDAEFVRSMSSNVRRGSTSSMYGHPRVVDSLSCRQLYLRSYNFSREEDEEKTIKCLGKGNKEKEVTRSGGGKRRSAGMERAKMVSCAALRSIFRRLLSCTTEIDVAD
ncbi:hypothetical protein F511_23085 [Dorcoceras hygrometricum]|uniref:Uncharacterized protein n=1 Tax=Dorcoceras hygrometricum TaxID=472368 RepID=A0A2Z7APW5_9LAMI|nr:hypothetical protein F511_23085 [Dorcoceras hygrometricum]